MKIFLPRYHLDSVRSLDSYLASERAAEDYCNEVVDGAGRLLHLDSTLSVSAMVEVEDDFDYDPAHVELNALFERQLERNVDPSCPLEEVS